MADKIDELAHKYRLKFEESVRAERDYKRKSEKNEKYYYGEQLTDWEKGQYKRKGRAPIVVNEIQPAVDRLLGEEEMSNFQWEIAPVEKNDEKMSQGFENLLRTVRRKGQLQYAASDMDKDGVITGRGIMEIYADKGVEDDEITIKYRHVPWDEFWIEKNCRHYDIARNAKYVFRAKWVSKEQAKKMFPESEKKIEHLVETVQAIGVEGSDIEEDLLYSDSERDRVRIVECWYRKGKQIRTLYFSKSFGFHDRRATYYIKKDEDGKYKMDEKDYDDEEFLTFIPFVKYAVKEWYRENNWFGLIDNLISSQDEINHRHMKALFALDTRGIIADEDSIDEPQRKTIENEISKPNFAVWKKAGREFEIVNNDSITQQQYQIMLAAENRLRRVGGLNNEFMGLESNAQSGRAISARSSESRKIQGKIFGNARRSNIIIGELTCKFVAAIYDKDIAVRILNDEKTAEETIKVSPKDIPYDIVVSQARLEPDYRLSQLEALSNASQQFGLPVPPEMVLEFIDIDNKEKYQQEIRKIMQAQSQPDPEKQANAAKKMADAQLSQIRAQKTGVEAQQVGMEMQSEQVEMKKTMEESKKINAETLKIFAELRALTQELKQQGMNQAAMSKALTDPSTQYFVQEGGSGGED